MPTRMIRLSTLSLVLTLCYFAGEAQEYKQMMDDHSVNVYDVIDAAEKYYQTHPKGKGSGWKNYQRWKHVNEANFFPSGDRSQIAPDHAWKAYYHFMANYQTGNFTEQENGGTAGAESGPWTELGPWAANNVTGSWSPGLGRVETFYIDPSDSNHIYLGSRSGGFWKTNDGGQTWNCTTDTLPVIGIPSLAVSPTSSDSIFIATRTNLSAYSIGLLQSSDGGDTWQTTNLSLDAQPLEPGRHHVAPLTQEGERQHAEDLSGSRTELDLRWVHAEVLADALAQDRRGGVAVGVVHAPLQRLEGAGGRAEGVLVLVEP